MVRIRDLPIGGCLTYPLWRKRRFACEACGRTFTETRPGLWSRQRVSALLRGRPRERYQDGAALAEVARDEQTSRYEVQRSYQQGGEELLARRHSRPARRLSLDEAHHRRRHELATIVSDLDRGRVMEVLDGRSRQVVERYLRAPPEQHRRAIRVVSIDPYDAYRQAIRNELPWARIVVDHFHLVRGVNTALDSVRRERQRERATRGPKGAGAAVTATAGIPTLYRARHELLTASERLTENDRRLPYALFERDTVLAEAWGLKEVFRCIYRAQDRIEPRSAFNDSYSPSNTHDYAHSVRSRKASWIGRPSCWPTSTSRPPTATPKVSSTR